MNILRDTGTFNLNFLAPKSLPTYFSDFKKLVILFNGNFMSNTPAIHEQKVSFNC